MAVGVGQVDLGTAFSNELKKRFKQLVRSRVGNLNHFWSGNHTSCKVFPSNGGRIKISGGDKKISLNAKDQVILPESTGQKTSSWGGDFNM